MQLQGGEVDVGECDYYSCSRSIVFIGDILLYMYAPTISNITAHVYSKALQLASMRVFHRCT